MNNNLMTQSEWKEIFANNLVDVLKEKNNMSRYTYDFTYNNYTSKGNRVVLTPNALRHLKNIIPFGIAFMAEGNVEPFDITDFASGRVGMYILNQEEVKEIESNIYGA